MKQNLPPLRPGLPAPSALLARRAAGSSALQQQGSVAGVEVAEYDHAGVLCVECRVPDPQRTFLHFHGGGYRMGHPRAWAAFGSRLAKLCQARVVLPDYRLAPEFPFPAALHDAAAVYAALVKDSVGKVIASGDSAGGGLATSLVVACATLGLSRPPALILISPWLDLTVEAETYTSRAASDKLFSREAANEGSTQYLQGLSPQDPLASPLFADLTDFPPVQIFAGGDEVLLGDSLSFVSRLAQAGGTVEAHFVGGMQHDWPPIFPELKESEAAIAAMVRFACTHTAP